jgi:CDK-activating kinase assembly factor MAT1
VLLPSSRLDSADNDCVAFNLLNDVDLEKTEARIFEFARKNATIIAANRDRALLEALSQVERDKVEKEARRERRKMVEDNERMEEEARTKMERDVTEAVVSIPFTSKGVPPRASY